MKNFKIAKKLLVSFGAVLAMLVVACVVALFGLTSVGNNLNNFYERPFQVTNKASDMQTSIQSAAKYVGYATMTPDPTRTKEYVDAAQAELAKLKEGADFMKENFSNPEMVDEFLEVMNASVEVKEQVFAYATANENDKAIDLYFNGYQQYLLDGMTILKQINDLSVSNADNMYKNANASKNASIIFLIIVALVSIGMTIAVAIYLTKLLTAPIREIENAAKRLSEGDLDIDITYESKDELGELSNSFKKTITILKSIIKDMNALIRNNGKW